MDRSIPETLELCPRCAIPPRRWRRGSGSLLWGYRCPRCGFRAPTGRPENEARLWNDAVRLRRFRESEHVG